MKHQLIFSAKADTHDDVIPLPSRRLHDAKRSFATRRVDLDSAKGIITTAVPRAGDIVLAQVTRVGQHQRLEDPQGRRAALFEGDHIVVAYGNRYAPDQFEAHVPGNLGPCDLVAGGGIASVVVSKSDKVRAATSLQPVGLLTDSTGRRLNTAAFALPALAPKGNEAAGRAHVIAVVGSSMNAGKTTALAALAQGECRSGRSVAALKVTGTGSGGDLWCYRDAGADLCLDFTDAGHATTHLLSDAERVEIFGRLLERAQSAPGIETILIEVADGLLLGETERLILSQPFRERIDAVVYAAADAMGALAGAEWLQQRNFPLQALTGAFTASPLAVAEVRARTTMPVLTRADLASGAFSLRNERMLTWIA